MSSENPDKKPNNFNPQASNPENKIDIHKTLLVVNEIKSIFLKNLPEGQKYQYLHDYIDELLIKYWNNEKYIYSLIQADESIRKDFFYGDGSFSESEKNENNINWVDIPNETHVEDFFDKLRKLPWPDNDTFLQDRLKLLAIYFGFPLPGVSNEIILWYVSQKLIKEIASREDDPDQVDYLLDWYYNWSNIAVIEYDKDCIQISFRNGQNHTIIFVW